MDSIKNERLKRERLPRYIVSGVFVVIGLFFLFKNRSKALVWFLISTVTYLAVFHFQYAILQGRTYSLSSVLSSSDIINTTAFSTAIAFLIAWLVMFIALRVYSEKPLQAANIHLAFAFTALFIVSLPALWGYAYNGALVTWTLPDMSSTFMAFLTILQILILAVMGLLFTGITPLVTLAFKKQ